MTRKCNWCDVEYETPDLQDDEELEEEDKYCSELCEAWDKSGE